MKGAFAIAISLCLLGIQMAHAGPTGGVIRAPKVAERTIVIDGDLKEWQLGLFTDKQKIVLTRKNGFINAGTIDDDKDFSAIVYAVYDSKNLYIGVEVTDDATDKAQVGGNNWQNDCIESWIDGAGDAGTMTDRGGNDPDNYQLNVDVNGLPWVYRNDDAAKILAQIESKSLRKGTNYTLEVQIPMQAIPELKLKPEAVMGFSVSFVDSDNAVWNHILWQGEVENEPGQWGKLIFASEALAVEPGKKLTTRWGWIKRQSE